jgi:beta-galactosidase
MIRRISCALVLVSVVGCSTATRSDDATTGSNGEFGEASTGESRGNGAGSGPRVAGSRGTGGNAGAGDDGSSEGGPASTTGSHAPFSLDPRWKFIRQDALGAQAPTFDDRAWTTVSTPHTYNDIDSYTKLISHASGDTASYTGPAWYRKHFKIPSQYSTHKVIVELERIKQGARFYINGMEVGVCDDGITACGIDLTDKVNFGGTENVLAVRVDNSNNYVESTTGVGFQWMGRAFNPNYGGLIGHVWLHLPSKVYQTYPLYNNLLTTGIYIYPSAFSNISKSQGDLTVHVESQIKNESGAAQTVTLSAQVVDPATATSVATFQGATSHRTFITSSPI